eukprot:TRINITY_DN2213_c0_g1_i1.p1 TRINITY_DN2213_c0_g1~~TRINITY_DN2213_c0_g1_i1.p1  ORF type:complete len:216 (-),score=-16.72 TRINITY_DN2213_c0_g1_i1:199-846(-)
MISVTSQNIMYCCTQLLSVNFECPPKQLKFHSRLNQNYCITENPSGQQFYLTLPHSSNIKASIINVTIQYILTTIFSTEPNSQLFLSQQFCQNTFNSMRLVEVFFQKLVGKNSQQSFQNAENYQTMTVLNRISKFLKVIMQQFQNRITSSKPVSTCVYTFIKNTLTKIIKSNLNICSICLKQCYKYFANSQQNDFYDYQCRIIEMIFLRQNRQIK